MSFRFHSSTSGNHHLDRIKAEARKLDPDFPVPDKWIFGMKSLHAEIDRIEAFIESKGKAGPSQAKAAATSPTAQAAISILKDPRFADPRPPAPASPPPRAPVSTPAPPVRTASPGNYDRLDSLRQLCKVAGEKDAIGAMARTLDGLSGPGSADALLASHPGADLFEQLVNLDAACSAAEAQQKPVTPGGFTPVAGAPSLASLRFFHATVFPDTKQIESRHAGDAQAQYQEFTKNFFRADIKVAGLSFAGLSVADNGSIWLTDSSRKSWQAQADNFFAVIKNGESSAPRGSAGAQLAAKFLRDEKRK